MMAGELGNDVYFVDDSNDQVMKIPAGAMTQSFRARAFNSRPRWKTWSCKVAPILQGVGNSLNNQLYGNSGNNTLNGGIGADVLLGFTATIRWTAAPASTS